MTADEARRLMRGNAVHLVRTAIEKLFLPIRDRATAGYSHYQFNIHDLLAPGLHKEFLDKLAQPPYGFEVEYHHFYPTISWREPKCTTEP